jgi:8-amino-7-oxononanoate synthase
LDFASNDYLGLSRHPAVVAAACEAVIGEGAGAGASRLITGSLPLHHALEAAIAAFKNLPAALSFSTGHATALGTIPALVGPGDYVLLDRLAHACLVDGARLSGAKLRVWKHNDVGDLARLLEWVGRQDGSGERRAHTLVVTESVFSMDGDVAPLREIVACRDAVAPGAWLMVDEAHATGVLGAGGRGWIDELGLTGRVEVSMGTLGKAAGVGGGFVAGSEVLIEYLVNRARSFLFSTAPVPAAAGAAQAALGILRSPEGDGLRSRLWQRVAEVHAGLAAMGWELPPPSSPIVPVIVGAEDRAMHLAGALREQGFLVPAIRHPTVQRGRARLRITLSALHAPEDVEGLLVALRRALGSSGIPGPARF